MARGRKKNVGVESFEEMQRIRREGILARGEMNWELLGGRKIAGYDCGAEGKRLCFLLGTVFQDYFLEKGMSQEVVFGPIWIPIDKDTRLRPDLVVVSLGANPFDAPEIVVSLLSADREVYDSIDKAAAYQRFGVKHYLLIDLLNKNIGCYDFTRGFDYKRLQFEERVYLPSYPDFSFSIMEMMWQEGGCLKDLALFYRFKTALEDKQVQFVVAEDGMSYSPGPLDQKNARDFYEWIEVRKNKGTYLKCAELFMGNIQETDMPGDKYLDIRGELYYTVKKWLKRHAVPYRLLFSPVAVELTKNDYLDCVLVPDLFLISEDETVENGIYRGAPLWVVEIATPQNAVYDYVDKAQIYQFHGVKEYWIVNKWKEQVLVMNFKSVDMAGASIRMDQNVWTAIYDFDTRIPVRSIPGLEIRMCDVLEIPKDRLQTDASLQPN